jgi:hypothetical protein
MGHHACQQHSHVNICNKAVVLLIFLFKKYKADSINFTVSYDWELNLWSLSQYSDNCQPPL